MSVPLRSTLMHGLDVREENIKIDENKVEVIGGLLLGVGLILIFFDISAPLIAGSILSGAVVIARSINPKYTEMEVIEKKEQDEY